MIEGMNSKKYANNANAYYLNAASWGEDDAVAIKKDIEGLGFRFDVKAAIGEGSGGAGFETVIEVVLGQVGVGLLTNIIYDLVKKAVRYRPKHNNGPAELQGYQLLIHYDGKIIGIDLKQPPEHIEVAIKDELLKFVGKDFWRAYQHGDSWDVTGPHGEKISVERTIHRDITSALIFSKDGKLLMGMKDPKDGGVYADCWHIPGGGVDESETQQQALRREILEEVGIDITGCNVTLADDQGSGETKKTLKDTGEKVMCHMKFYVYRVDVDKNADQIETKPSDDLVKLEWVDLDKLSSYKLTPPSVTLFQRLGYIKNQDQNHSPELQMVGVVAGCVIEQAGKYLLVQERKPKTYGQWNLPAGRVDKGETIEDYAVRETLEETGFNVTLGKQIAIVHTAAAAPVLHAFSAIITGGELKPNLEELLDARWLSLDEIRELNAQGKIREGWALDMINKSLKSE